jgi:hypothetical protein
MPHRKETVGLDARRTMAKVQEYELRYFARRHNVQLAEARRLLKLHGNKRAKLEAAIAAEA